MQDITDVVLDQFQRTLTMFREAAQAFPADEWREGITDYARPAGVAYHIVETMDFYTSSQSADDFAWGGRFGVDWTDGRSELLPSQGQVAEYLVEVEARLVAWLGSADLMSPEQQYPWTGANGLARAIYVLRNTQHHVSEMGIELTRRGFSAPDWR